MVIREICTNGGGNGARWYRNGRTSFAEGVEQTTPSAVSLGKSSRMAVSFRDQQRPNLCADARQSWTAKRRGERALGRIGRSFGDPQTGGNAGGFLSYGSAASGAESAWNSGVYLAASGDRRP